MFKYKCLSLVLASTLFVACGSSSSSNTNNTPLTSSKNIVVKSSEIISSSSFPSEVSAAKEIGYANMIQLNFQGTSNSRALLSGDTIRIIAVDDGVNGEKTRRAADIMASLLSNLDVNENVLGKTKEDIIKTMASRQATLFINTTENSAAQMSLKLYTKNAISTSDINMQTIINTATLASEFTGVDLTNYNAVLNKLLEVQENEENNNISEENSKFEKYQKELIKATYNSTLTPAWIKNSQDLYFSEMSLEGNCDYLKNFDSSCPSNLSASDRKDRDASIEEILHIIQAQGIAPSTRTKTLQGNIDKHAKDIYDRKLPIWSPDKDTWDEWLADDLNPEIGTTYSHEYFASIVESYYGLWRHKSAGLDSYNSVKREDITTNDPTGLTYLKEFIPEYHQYTARIQSADVKDYYDKLTSPKMPVFKMSLSSDVDEKYTYKSQYLINAKLIGDAQISLEGNNQNNILEGNSKDNSINGKEGVDTYVIDGNSTDYTVTTNSSNKITVVQGSNIGTDLLTNMEYIQFKDKKVKIN